MNRSQVLRKLRSYCKTHNLALHFDSSEGNSSHGTIYVEDRRAVAKHGEWPKAYLHLVLKQLGVPKDAF